MRKIHLSDLNFLRPEVQFEIIFLFAESEDNLQNGPALIWGSGNSSLNICGSPPQSIIASKGSGLGFDLKRVDIPFNDTCVISSENSYLQNVNGIVVLFKDVETIQEWTITKV